MGEVSTAVLAEYWHWIQVERAEGLELYLMEETLLHLGLLRQLLAVYLPLMALTMLLGVAGAILYTRAGPSTTGLATSPQQPLECSMASDAGSIPKKSRVRSPKPVATPMVNEQYVVRG